MQRAFGDRRQLSGRERLFPDVNAQAKIRNGFPCRVRFGCNVATDTVGRGQGTGGLFQGHRKFSEGPWIAHGLSRSSTTGIYDSYSGGVL